MLQHRSSRAGLGYVDCLALILVVSVLLGMICHVVQKVREAERQVQCRNNLRQIGTSVHNFHSDYKRLPTDSDWFDGRRLDPAAENHTVFAELLVYLEKWGPALGNSGVLTDPNQSLLLGKGLQVKTFLCPSRGCSGPRGDYAAPLHVAWFSLPGKPEEAVPWYSVFGGVIPLEPGRGVDFDPSKVEELLLTLSKITNKDGMATTMLFAHKGVAPQSYRGSGPNDQGYAYLGNSWEHKRLPFYLRQDYGDLGSLQAHEIFTSPHPGMMPVVFCPGDVRNLNYDIAPEVLARLCSWNDGEHE